MNGGAGGLLNRQRSVGVNFCSPSDERRAGKPFGVF